MSREMTKEQEVEEEEQDFSASMPARDPSAPKVAGIAKHAVSLWYHRSWCVNHAAIKINAFSIKTAEKHNSRKDVEQVQTGSWHNSERKQCSNPRRSTTTQPGRKSDGTTSCSSGRQGGKVRSRAVHMAMRSCTFTKLPEGKLACVEVQAVATRARVRIGDLG